MMPARLDSAAAAARWLRAAAPARLCTDSRDVRPGDAFIAWPGRNHDARRFVAQALSAGAVACVVEAEGVETFDFRDQRVAALPRLAARSGDLADRWFGHPSHRLHVLASTGTNGKTSTAWWIAQALGALGRRCGVIGTLGAGEPPRVRLPGREALGDAAGDPIELTGLTTPDPVRLHGELSRMADAGYSACAIEASSIGIDAHRLDAVHIEVALFTNFTRDHLDYHGSMQAYWDAKARLFEWPGLRAAVIDVDDPKGPELAERCARAGLDVWTCSVRGAARLKACGLVHGEHGLGFDVHEAGSAQPVQTALIGDFNVSNLLLVIGALRVLGVTLTDAAQACGVLTPVPGRMQRVGSTGAPQVVVDYAHTPDALDKALSALRPLVEARGGRLWCVFGCGGNRDTSKRPLMGAIAHRLADRLVLTSDNPRDEMPAQILAQIVAGIDAPQQVELIEDRARAITRAVCRAAPQDVILVAGKGHEAYQEIAGRRLPFSDADAAARALRQRGPGA